MKTNLLMLLAGAIALGGCAVTAPATQAVLAQGKPIAMYTLPDCKGYVVQSGMALPLGQRMEELDQICLALTHKDKAEPAAAAASSAK